MTVANAEFWHKVADERAAEITRLRSDNQKLREALEPFLAEMPDDDRPDHCSHDAQVSVAEMRRARAALAEGDSNG